MTDKFGYLTIRDLRARIPRLADLEYGFRKGRVPNLRWNAGRDCHGCVTLNCLFS
jgi:hypothetical protein